MNFLIHFNQIFYKHNLQSKLDRIYMHNIIRIEGTINNTLSPKFIICPERGKKGSYTLNSQYTRLEKRELQPEL